MCPPKISFAKLEEEAKKSTSLNNSSSTNSKDEPTTNWKSYTSNMTESQTKLMESVFEGTPELDAMFRNSFNGQYRSLISNEKLTGELPDKFKELGTTAWNIAKSIKSNDDSKKLNELRTQFSKLSQDVFLDVQTKYAGEYDFDENTLRLMKHGNTSQNKNALHVTGSSIDVKVKATYANPFEYLLAAGKYATGDVAGAFDTINPIEIEKDPKKAYRNVVGNKHEMQNMVLEPMRNNIKNWTDYGFANFDNDEKGQTFKVDNRERIVGLSEELFKFVGKYGTKNEKDKQTAEKLLKEYREGTDSFDSKVGFVNKNKDQIKKLVDNIGFHGSKYLYERFENKFGLDYYGGSDTDNLNIKKERYSNSKNEIAALLKDMNTVNDTYFKIAKDVANDLKQVSTIKDDPLLKQSYNLMFEEGKLLDWKEFEQKAKKSIPNYLDDNGVRRFGNATNEQWMIDAINNPEASAYMGRVNKSMDPSYNDLKNAYYEVKDLYHEKFSDADPDKIFDRSLVTGLESKRSNVLTHYDVDLKNDTRKNNNVKTIKNMLLNEVSNGNVYVKSGSLTYSVTEDNLKSTQTKDRVNVTNQLFSSDEFKAVSFVRNTPIKGHSAYVFSSKGEKGKTVNTTFYVPTELAESYGEEIAKGTKLTPSDWSFQVNSVWKIPTTSSSAVRNARIIVEDGMKVLKGDFKMPDGSMQTVSKRIAEHNKVDIKLAEKMAFDIIDKYNQNLD